MSEQQKNTINKLACPTVSAKIARDLKEALPNFAKNVNGRLDYSNLKGFKDDGAKVVFEIFFTVNPVKL